MGIELVGPPKGADKEEVDCTIGDLILRLLIKTTSRVSGGDMENTAGMMICWVNAEGLVEYELSENISADAAIVMATTVNYDASVRMWGGEE